MSHSENIVDIDLELLTACSNSKISSKEIQKFISLGADVNCETKKSEKKTNPSKQWRNR